jgi:serine protease
MFRLVLRLTRAVTSLFIVVLCAAAVAAAAPALAAPAATRTLAALTAGAGMLTGPTPAVSGSRKVGNPLTALPGAWTRGATLKYQWLRSGAPIAGATAANYTLTAADLGKIIKVRVVGFQPGHTTVAKDSLPAAPDAAGILTAPASTISGTPKAGSALTPGAWTTGTTLRYQWYRSGTPIIGATATTYRLTAADRSATIKVRVIGSYPGYTAAIRYSTVTTRVTQRGAPSSIFGPREACTAARCVA